MKSLIKMSVVDVAACIIKECTTARGLSEDNMFEERKVRVDVGRWQESRRCRDGEM